jgi:Ca-activated chloride channel homolog
VGRFAAESAVCGRQRDRLREQGIDVTDASVEGFSKRLAGQDAVILSDVPAKKIDRAAAQRLETFVRERGALFFAAGVNTYGEHGFAKSTVERLLPVEFQGKRKRRELDMVVLIDRSFSMGGEKLELAKSAALATLDLFDQRHRLAIVSFDSTLEDVLPLHEVGNKSRAQKMISEMFAAGQTNIFQALWFAHRLLEDSPAKTKHIILLSDGETGSPQEPDPKVVSPRVLRTLREQYAQNRGLGPSGPAGDAARVAQGVRDAAALLSAAGITLSTVTIGEEPNLQVMRALAKQTRGKSYVPKSDAEIPSLFVAETKRLMGESIVEKPFRPIVKIETAALENVDFAAAPPLKGYVIAKPKPFAEVLLEAKDEHPLLVQTHYGLGKTVAFTSDVKNRWAADWLNWPDYGKLWAQLIRSSIRRDTAEDLQLGVAREGGAALATLSAKTAAGGYRNDIAPLLRVTEPPHSTLLAPLRQTGPGKYQARIALPNTHAEPYRFELVEGPGVGAQDIARAGTRSVAYAYPDEYRVYAPNVALLKSLSEQTFGKFAPRTDEIFADYGDAPRVAWPLWRHLAWGALVVFLLDILVRRLNNAAPKTQSTPLRTTVP